MKKNMGWVDKIIRLVVAALFVVLYFTKVITGVWGIVILALAAMFVITSLFSFCPLYLPFGIKTNNCSKKEV
jgi:O-antigen/teichoic acid export membrane protein